MPNTQIVTSNVLRLERKKTTPYLKYIRYNLFTRIWFENLNQVFALGQILTRKILQIGEKSNSVKKKVFMEFLNYKRSLYEMR